MIIVECGPLAFRWPPTRNTRIGLPSRKRISRTFRTTQNAARHATSPMDLHLLRTETTDGITLGKLFIDGKWTWFTLEVGEGIRHGTYPVAVTPSSRLQCDLPFVMHVPQVHSVRFYAGNLSPVPPGWILVGGGINKGTSRLSVVACKEACSKLTSDIIAAIHRGERVYLSIEPVPVNTAPAILRSAH